MTYTIKKLEWKRRDSMCWVETSNIRNTSHPYNIHAYRDEEGDGWSYCSVKFKTLEEVKNYAQECFEKTVMKYLNAQENTDENS